MKVLPQYIPAKKGNLDSIAEECIICVTLYFSIKATEGYGRNSSKHVIKPNLMPKSVTNVTISGVFV